MTLSFVDSHIETAVPEYAILQKKLVGRRGLGEDALDSLISLQGLRCFVGTQRVGPCLKSIANL